MAIATDKENIPVKVVGSSSFGRYEKISEERTYNFFISDGWLVGTPGFQRKAFLDGTGKGRGVFNSVRGEFAIAVVGMNVYKISESLGSTIVGMVSTSEGIVSIDENLSSQIAIADGVNLYIYNYSTGGYATQSLTWNNPDTGVQTVEPNYVSYHNAGFLIGSNENSIDPQNWYVAKFATSTTVTIAQQDQFSIQTKPDYALAVRRIPGRGNNVIVFGRSVSEVWTQVGGAENYRRIQSFNIDYGVASSATIAASDTFVVWIGINEKNAPIILMTDGAQVKHISTDGIDHLLDTMKRPDKSNGFLYRLDGHLFYQFTFFDDEDNLSMIYDFNQDKFFHITREALNYHPAVDVIYFNEMSLFVSLLDGYLYHQSTNYISYDYRYNNLGDVEDIPRMRVCNTIRTKDSKPFRIQRFSFIMEQGVTDFSKVDADQLVCQGLVLTEDDGIVLTEDGGYVLTEDGFCTINIERPKVQLSLSKNGNQSFGTKVARLLNPEGIHRNEISWNRMGRANEISLQLNFWGLQRFVASDGVLTVY